MDITNNNGHEETPAEEREAALTAEVERLTTALAQSHDIAREQAREAEERRDQLRTHYDERMATLRERYNAEAMTKQERLDQVLATDQGKAYTEVEDMKRQVTRAEELAERYRGRMTQAESDRDRALASVEGGEDIHPADPRVAHIWRKASRIATSNGYCTEYDKIAEALGLPEVEFDYSGYVSVRVNAYVSVPVSGTATRREIADGEVDWSLDNSDILSEMDSDSIEWEVDEVEIEAQDD
jgi:acetyl-CoA acetyltransferase